MSTGGTIWLDEQSISWSSQPDPVAAAARPHRSRREPRDRRARGRAAVLALLAVLAGVAYASLPATQGSAPVRQASARAAAARSAGPLPAIAHCESRGDPNAVSPGGQYRGKYQFDRATWRSVGGHGDPASAPVREQDTRAELLMARRGTAPWPVCGSAGR